ncbi:LPXTG cell wall anchor domain-containing protein [Lacticaseibacillus pabuli]|uniref:LPXTG cell wall anchor domain-containing protein n=1 Tax=Lacticaseibacillus pabuli TaxID=3025672 RepID=A0ABY7WY40_9LACO|nr:LPXTG cell wall anchor domain-containing protein [Lacticaseibacillus sp. KACC 23028]WDF82840.1 LPXTG cell wall anchor domain-containing protein [Lacticaseibacillus sp. KACC 23028]
MLTNNQKKQFDIRQSGRKALQLGLVGLSIGTAALVAPAVSTSAADYVPAITQQQDGQPGMRMDHTASDPNYNRAQYWMSLTNPNNRWMTQVPEPVSVTAAKYYDNTKSATNTNNNGSTTTPTGGTTTTSPSIPVGPITTPTTPVTTNTPTQQPTQQNQQNVQANAKSTKPAVTHPTLPNTFGGTKSTTKPATTANPVNAKVAKRSNRNKTTLAYSNSRSVNQPQRLVASTGKSTLVTSRTATNTSTKQLPQTGNQTNIGMSVLGGLAFVASLFGLAEHSRHLIG